MLIHFLLKLRSSYSVALPILSIVLGSALVLRADTLSNNLDQPTSGVDAIQGSIWSAAGFSTGTEASTLVSVTLLMDQNSSGTARLALFSDSANVPASLLGVLTSPSSFTGNLSDTAFGGNGLALAADTSYWLVLSSTQGGLGWAYSANNLGAGAGFSHLWSSSFDSGSSWTTFDSLPYQLSVDANAGAATPEPAMAGFIALGIVLVLAFLKRANLTYSMTRRKTASVSGFLEQSRIDAHYKSLASNSAFFATNSSSETMPFLDSSASRSILENTSVSLA